MNAPWPPSHVAMAEKMWGDGETGEAIASAINDRYGTEYSGGAVTGMARKYRDRFPKRAPGMRLGAKKSGHGSKYG